MVVPFGNCCSSWLSWTNSHHLLMYKYRWPSFPCSWSGWISDLSVCPSFPLPLSSMAGKCNLPGWSPTQPWCLRGWMEDPSGETCVLCEGPWRVEGPTEPCREAASFQLFISASSSGLLCVLACPCRRALSLLSPLLPACAVGSCCLALWAGALLLLCSC